MRKLFFLMVFILIFFAYSQAEEVALTLDEAVALALRDNREILLKAEDVKKAKERIAEARSDLFPHLSFLGGWTDTKGLSQKDLTITTTQTTVRQLIFKGGEIVNTIKFTQYGMEAAKAVLDKAKLETALNVKNAYYTLLLAYDFTQLNNQILENTLKHLEYIQARYKQGEASESDILKIKDALGGVNEAYTASLNQVEASQELLKNILFLEEKIKIKPLNQFSYEPSEIVYDKAFLKSMKNRPEIRQYEAQIKAAGRAIEIAKAKGRPMIYGSWEYFSRNSAAIASAGTITGATGNTNSHAWNDYNTLGFTFSWPVFDGWETKARVDQAIVDLKESRLLRDKGVKDIVTELKNAYLGLENSIAAINSSETNVNFYKDELTVVEQKKKEGIASFLDADDAFLRYNIALFNKKQAIYDYMIAKAKFDKATGGS